MHSYNRRATALVLAICLALSLALVLPPQAAQAAEEDTVVVGGVVLSDGQYVVNGGTEAVQGEPDGSMSGYAYLSNGVLTLCNYTFSSDGGGAQMYAIYSESGFASAGGELTIELVGTNSLTTSNNGFTGRVINIMQATLRIRSATTTASSSLSVTGTQSATSTSNTGIYAPGIRFESGRVGVQAMPGVSVDGGGLYVEGGEVEITGTNTFGIDAKGPVVVSSGRLTVRTTAQSGLYAISAKNIVNDEPLIPQIAPSMQITTPTNGTAGVYETENYGTILDGSMPASEVVIEPAVPQGSAVAVTVGAVELADGQYVVNGGTEAVQGEPDGSMSGYAYLNNGVLTLKDYSYTGTPSSVLEIHETITLELQGSSSLKNEHSAMENDCVRVDEDAVLRIQGTGSLHVESTKGIGIAGSTVRIDSGTVTVKGGTDGVSADSLTVNGGTLEAEGASYGVYSEDTVTITGGTVKASSSTGTGIEAGSVMIYGGSVEVTGTDEFGIAAYDSMLISDGILHAKGGIAALACTDGDIHIQPALKILKPTASRIEKHPFGERSYSMILDGSGQPAKEVLIQGIPHEKGDVNGDGRIGLDDAVRCARIAVTASMNQVDPVELLLADIDGSGDVNLLDVQAICRYLVGAGTLGG